MNTKKPKNKAPDEEKIKSPTGQLPQKGNPDNPEDPVYLVKHRYSK